MDSFDTEAPFLGLDFSITYDKRDDIYFEKVSFPFLLGMFLAPLSVMFVFCSLLVLQEYVLISVASAPETTFDCLVISDKVIDIKKSEFDHGHLGWVVAFVTLLQCVK